MDEAESGQADPVEARADGGIASLPSMDASAIEDVEAGGLARAGLGAMSRTSALFAAGALSGKVIGLIMLPILTRMLTPAEVGNLDVLMTLTNTLLVTIQLGLDVAALRLYFDQPTREAQRALLRTWFAITMSVSVATGLVIFELAPVVSSALFSSPDLQLALVAVSVAVVAGSAQTILLTVLRARAQAGRYALVNVTTLVLYAVLATTLLVHWRADPTAVITGWAIALVVVMGTGTFLLRRDLIGRPAGAPTRRLLRLGLPLAPAIIGTLISEFLIRFVLLKVSGSDQVAYFTVGNRFASVAALSLAVLQLAWVPRAYAVAASAAPEARGAIGREGTWIIALVALSVLAIATGSRAIVEVAAGPGYEAALPPLSMALLGVLGAAVYLVASMPSAVGRATEDLSLATGLAAVVGIVGTAALASVFGASAAAGSQAAGQMVAVVAVAILGRRRASIGLEWSRILPITLATGAATLVLASDAWIGFRLGGLVLALVVMASRLRVRDAVVILRRSLPQ
jgi:O-antigen/teichoic acid export membrane protein